MKIKVFRNNRIEHFQPEWKSKFLFVSQLVLKKIITVNISIKMKWKWWKDCVFLFINNTKTSRICFLRISCKINVKDTTLHNECSLAQAFILKWVDVIKWDLSSKLNTFELNEVWTWMKKSHSSWFVFLIITTISTFDISTFFYAHVHISTKSYKYELKPTTSILIHINHMMCAHLISEFIFYQFIWAIKWS